MEAVRWRPELSMAGPVGRSGLTAFVPACCLVLFCAATAAAQDAGSIWGVAEDELGGLLPGVTVTARHSATGLARSVVTNDAGIYEIVPLPRGDYEVTVFLPGFHADPAAAAVAGSEVVVDFVLSIAPLAETVTVTRSEQSLDDVANAVTLLGPEALGFTERKASLDEALRGVPGLTVQNRRDYGLTGGIALSVRAPPSEPMLGIRGLAVVQDGIPLTTTDGTTEPGNVDLGAVRRIEVIRGPSSVLYGNAAGGVINLVTEIDPTRRLTIRPDLQWGSYGYHRQQLRVDGRNDRGTRFMGSVSRFLTDGWRRHSQAEVRQANVVVRQALSPRTELSLVFNHYDLPFAANPSYLSAAEAADPRLPAAERGQDPRQPSRWLGGTTVARENWGESALQMQGGATLEHRFSGAHVLNATVWAARRRVDTALVNRTLDLSRRGAGLRSTYQGAAEVGPTTFRWTAGVDASSKDENRLDYHFLPPFVVGGTAHRGALNFDQQELVASAAPFGQLSVSPHPRVTLTAGARYDHYRFRAADRKLDDGDQSGRRTMSAHSPTLGMTVASGAGPQCLRQLRDRLRDAHHGRACAVAGRAGRVQPRAGPVAAPQPRARRARADRAGPAAIRGRRLPLAPAESDSGDPSQRRCALLRQCRRDRAQRRRVVAGLAACGPVRGPARLHPPGLRLPPIRARGRRLLGEARARCAAAPPVRGCRLRGAVRLAGERIGALGRRVLLHERQRGGGDQLGLHGGRPALRVDRTGRRRRRAALRGHRQPVQCALQLVGPRQPLQPSVLPTLAGPGGLRRADLRWRLALARAGLLAPPNPSQDSVFGPSPTAPGVCAVELTLLRSTAQTSSVGIGGSRNCP